MGMFSEANAEATAKKLEEIILSILAETDEESHAVLMLFAKKELVKWYYWECGETWGAYVSHPDIRKAFPPKEY